MLWRFLKRYTAGEGRKVIAGVREDNGWEAWRKLHMQFEPGLVMREAQVMLVDEGGGVWHVVQFSGHCIENRRSALRCILREAAIRLSIYNRHHSG